MKRAHEYAHNNVMFAPFTFLEFFAGGGMARLGLQRHFQCLFANDNDRKKCDAYRANFGDSDLIESDIANLWANDIPTADLAWASFPCQDLSLAGTREGMSAERSGTFWSFWRLMADLRRQGRAPAVMVIENVTGLLTSRGGADFAALVGVMADQGLQIGGVVLDAALFLPQSRPRLFIVAWDQERVSLPHRSGQVHPMLEKAVRGLPEHLKGNWQTLSIETVSERNLNLVDLIETDVPESVWRSEDDLQKLLAQMTPTHRSRVDNAVNTRERRVGAVFRRIRRGEQRAEIRYDGLSGCLRTLKGGSSRQLLLISEAGTLKLRAMQPREAARLMGLPESYILPKRATTAISLCGDGVCVPVVEWIGDQILAPLLHKQSSKLTL